MWTEEQRRIYRREGDGYPSDLRDAEWARLEPLIPKASPGGRPRKTDMRAAMNAILYLLRTGCPWRYLPHDGFPPRSTVYNIFRKFQREGTWEAIWAELRRRDPGSRQSGQSPASAVPRYRPGRGSCGLHLLAGVVTHCVVFAAPFSADFTDWLSRTAADGLASRPIRSRSAICSSAQIASQVPSRWNLRKML